VPGLGRKQFLHAPNVIGNTGLDCGRYASRSVDPAKVVVSEIEGVCRVEIFPLSAPVPIDYILRV